jgi:hypothetical protein
MNESSIVVVNVPEDSLANLIATKLQAQGTHVLHVTPDALGSLQTSLENDSFDVDGRPVGGILFRSSPNAFFSTGFKTEDQRFCDAEIRAAWLAALHLESVLAVNRYDAVAWFEGLDWPVWRRRLIQAGIPAAPFAVGDVASDPSYAWYPYVSHYAHSVPGAKTRKILGSALTQAVPAQVSLLVGDEIVAGKATPAVLAASELLRDAGVRIAEIVTDADERIITVNTLPMISDAQLGELVSQRIAGMYYAHLHSG